MERHDSALQRGGEREVKITFLTERMLNKMSRCCCCCYRKQFCATSCLKECATSGWPREELSVALGT